LRRACSASEIALVEYLDEIGEQLPKPKRTRVGTVRV
jgi:hypothetical protein